MQAAAVALELQVAGQAAQDEYNVSSRSVCYGMNSSEYEQAGGTRSSECKRPLRKKVLAWGASLLVKNLCNNRKGKEESL